MPPLSHLKGMSEVKTAEEIEANIKHLVGLQREELLEQPPQKPQQPEGEMSAFTKFVSLIDVYCIFKKLVKSYFFLFDELL